jgi:hypothetical protein
MDDAILFLKMFGLMMTPVWMGLFFLLFIAGLIKAGEWLGF